MNWSDIYNILLDYMKKGWRGIGEHQTEESHVLYNIGEINCYVQRAGFLINKPIKGYNRFITICLKISSFNMTSMKINTATISKKESKLFSIVTNNIKVIDTEY